MSRDDLHPLVAGLEERAVTAPTYADRDPEATVTLAVSCSMTGQCRVPSPWPLPSARTVTPVRTLGNQAWERRDGEPVPCADIAHLVTAREPEAVVVVGHTDCSVIADAYEARTVPQRERSTGVEARLRPLVSVVDDAIDAGIVDAATASQAARHRLVEYNVVRQVAFLADVLPAVVTVAGLVHDEDGAYSSFPDRHYLVTVDGETGTEAVRSRVPDGERAAVATLLD